MQVIAWSSKSVVLHLRLSYFAWEKLHETSVLDVYSALAKNLNLSGSPQGHPRFDSDVLATPCSVHVAHCSSTHAKAFALLKSYHRTHQARFFSSVQTLSSPSRSVQMVYWKFQALNWSLTRFGLLEIWEWFIVPESKLTSDPFELLPMLRDTNFVLVDYRQIGTAKVRRTDNDLFNTAPVAGCSSHFLAIFEFLGWIWSQSSYAVTLASCSPVFFRSIKTLFKKAATGRPLPEPHPCESAGGDAFSALALRKSVHIPIVLNYNFVSSRQNQRNPLAVTRTSLKPGTGTLFERHPDWLITMWSAANLRVQQATRHMRTLRSGWRHIQPILVE